MALRFEAEADAPGAVQRGALVFLAVIAGGGVVFLLREILAPLVIALLLLMLIDGLERSVARRLPGVPRRLAGWISAILILAGFAAVVALFAEGARSFLGELGGIAPRIDALLASLADRFGAPPVQLGDLLHAARSAAALQHVFSAARGFLSEAVLVVIYLGFMLASRGAFGRKMDRLFAAPEARAHAASVFDRIRSATEQYVGLQTLKAGAVASMAYVFMRLTGLSNPLFLALVLFLAAYVPIVGGAAAALLPALFALGEFDGPARPLILLALIGGSVFFVENVVLPKISGDRLNLDPVFILLSLAFWGAMLGATGALLSTPLTVGIMAIAGEFNSSRWLAVLLSKEGEIPGPGAAA